MSGQCWTDCLITVLIDDLTITSDARVMEDGCVFVFLSLSCRVLHSSVLPAVSKLQDVSTFQRFNVVKGNHLYWPRTHTSSALDMVFTAKSPAAS